MTVKDYLDLEHLQNCLSVAIDQHSEELKANQAKIRQYNKELLEKYPWLTPTNVWSGKKITDCANNQEKGFWTGDPDAIPEYYYDYTELDNMPEGWRIAFGDQMCEEIHQELVKYDFVDKYIIIQIKEKYGSLRWYDNGSPKESKINDIIYKYELLSETTCVNCGKPARWLSKGWICPFCDDCKDQDINYTEIKKN